ncbi:MAG TPA: PHP-associated domain-containing protein, partial [Phycisphaerae bacterium]|nr:PHP-associated domain-containing protein [Phycisphaerae bacterium]
MPNAYLESPYLQDDNALWLRGNLHTHTTRSDGQEAPQAMLDRYAELGYGFLGLSDHDVYGDATGLDARGLVLLPGVELSCGPHVLDVGARRLVPADTDHQALLDRVARDSGFAVLCHPNWQEDYAHYPYELLRTLTGYVGMEIYNGACIEMPGNHLATDKWDRLLTLGRKVWGFANDDAHAARHIGRGWNVARVREATAEAVLGALRAGSFYASNGVEIRSIACDGPVLRIHAPL